MFFDSNCDMTIFISYENVSFTPYRNRPILQVTIQIFVLFFTFKHSNPQAFNMSNPQDFISWNIGVML